MPAEQSEKEIYNVIDGNEPWKGRMLFTGPDGTKDHYMTIGEEHRQVGIGKMSREATSEADYLWRPATGTPFHKSRGNKVGEVGWGVPNHSDWKVPKSGKQIMLGEFRQACEDRHSHLYQNAWYPGPKDEFPESSDAALIMNVYRPKTTQATKAGSYRSSHSGRRFRRTPSATPTTMHYTSLEDTGTTYKHHAGARPTHFYTSHKYYTHTHPAEQETSDTNTSTQ